MTQQVLDGIKVVDLTQYIAGPYCTRLLAGFGAEVIKIEKPVSGDPARQIGPFYLNQLGMERSGMFLYLNTNKKSVVLNLKSADECQSFKELVKTADILVEGFRPGVMERLGIGYETLKQINPGLVMTSISNFGQNGPYRDYKLNHLIGWGLAGGYYTQANPKERPHQAGGWITHFITGLHAAAGTGAALCYRNKTGRGVHIDVSFFESMVLIPTYPAVVSAYRGEKYNKLGLNYLGIFPCKDGYIGLNVYTLQHWQMMCAFFGMPELSQDPRFNLQVNVIDNVKSARDYFYDKVKDRKKEELFQAGNEWRIPFGLIPTMKDILEFPQHRERKFFVEVNHSVIGKVTMPGAPFKLMATPWKQDNPAPLFGEHTKEVLARIASVPQKPKIILQKESPETDWLPLKGTRVIDVTNSWAGPFATQFFASLGAEVVKVESTKWTDPWRGGASAGKTGRFWEESPLYNSVNTDKLSVTLDLTHPKGVEIFKRLVKIGDIVAEIYTPRVMKTFGLDYDVLKEVNPSIMMLSMPSYGMNGPWRDYPGFAALFEQMSGLL